MQQLINAYRYLYDGVSDMIEGRNL